MLNRQCLVPLIRLCSGEGRLHVGINACNPCADYEATLTLIKAGCPEYDEMCVEDVEPQYGCGCPSYIKVPRIVRVERPRPKLTYPMLEIDEKGRAVFVLDGKLDTAGTGRYRAIVSVEGCADIEFDVDYTCNVTVTEIELEGARCVY